ncbi:hypothetical protein ACGK9U_13110 [Mariniflexile sp. HNIBRBA6329]|uniref:hypothetical protein n=1 Tax=Mariniflexile sp. HNIBRBA6329 TaxID=3373088 RepID=UPI003745F4BB
MMKNLLTIFVFVIIIIACKEKSSEFESNETVEYYPNKPNLIFKKTVNLTDFDSVYYFYDNGILFKKGKQFKENQKIGIWKLYDRNSNLREIREWFTINGKSRANRVWHLSEKGDTLALRYQDSIYKQKEFINDTTYFRNTNYDIVYFNRDTIKLNEPIRGYIEIGTRVLRHYPNYHVRACIATEDKNYNYDFSNTKQVKLDTFYDLTINTINQKWFEGANFNQLVVIGKYFDTTGDKTIRGFYEQYSYGPFEKDENGQTIDSIISYKTFFEKKIHVKDSLKINHSVQHI